jgi:hypothetical protein
MIYRTRGEHANHYATDAVQTNEEDKYTVSFVLNQTRFRENE